MCITLTYDYRLPSCVQNMTERRKAAVKDFALTKRLLVALLAGVIVLVLLLGWMPVPIKEAALANGVGFVCWSSGYIFSNFGDFHQYGVYTVNRILRIRQ